jgi:hypothetical protein
MKVRAPAEVRRSLLAEEPGFTLPDLVIAVAALLALLFAVAVLWAANGLGGTLSTEMAAGRAAPQAPPAILYRTGFEEGAEGWTGATASEVAGFGAVLGPIAGSATWGSGMGRGGISAALPVGDGVREAVIEFDLLLIDDPAGATGLVLLAGREVGRVTSVDGVPIVQPSRRAGVRFEHEMIAAAAPLGGRAAVPDGRIRIAVRVEAPGAELAFGFRSAVTGLGMGGAFAIDDVRVLGRPTASPAPSPAPGGPRS